MTVEEFLREQVEAGAFPGAALAYGDRAKSTIGAVGKLGFAEEWPAATPETLYDLASLTKVFATTMVTKALVKAGALNLAQRVSEVLPTFQHQEVTVEHLLRHESGLPPYLDQAESDFLAQLWVTPLNFVPGTRCEYSCLGFIVLRYFLEAVGGSNFDLLYQQYAKEPYALTETGFRRIDQTDPGIAPTAAPEPWRKQNAACLQGIVHDPLAYLQKGVSGNAGLFGNAKELAAVCQAILSDPTWTRWVERKGKHERALGWDLKSRTGTSCGETWSPDSFGHTGFTGTSVWFDPDRRIYALLLTNALHAGEKQDLRQIRSKFCDLAHSVDK